VQFHATLDTTVFQTAGPGPRIAVIAGRTPDNPRLFREALAAGATHVLLEKPGAPTVSDLEAMAQLASAKGVPVFMGFIKNISAYVEGALKCEAAASAPCEVSLISLNDYTRANLGECFSRCSEGLLKNMAIHELALAVQFWGMRASDVVEVRLAADGCEFATLGGLTDLVKVDMTLVASSGKTLRIVADRCATNGCCAVVRDLASGAVLYNEDMCGGPRQAACAARQAEHPDWISYLLSQEVEYAALKQTCAQHAVQSTTPPGVASIETAIEALKLAEYLTPLVTAKLA